MAAAAEQYGGRAAAEGITAGDAADRDRQDDPGLGGRGAQIGPAGTGGYGGFLMMDRRHRRLVKLSLAIVVYMACHVALFLRLSFPFPFERYFIWLQPAGALVLWLNLFAVGGMAGAMRGRTPRAAARTALAVGFALLAVLTPGERRSVMRERLYEMFHRYVGPMDYAVGFIRRTYAHPERLVIATDYEECVLEYYLGSRVTVGFVGNNLPADMAVEPDVIISRKRPSYTDEALRELWNRGREPKLYRRKEFDIFDSTTNTIPEVAPGENTHPYRTRRTGSSKLRLDLHYKGVRS
jgi:hypothetical protein